MAYKAFVSSTYEDLKQYRRYVIGALRKAGVFVDPMEDWTAASDEPKRFSQDRIKDCDLCVLLVAFRRGYVPEGETLSITQMEYLAAVKLGIDVLVFMLDEHSPWPRNFDELDKDPAVRQWRADLKKERGISLFGLEPNSIEVAPALTRWIADRQQPILFQASERSHTDALIHHEVQQVDQGVNTLNRSLLNLPPRPYLRLVGREQETKAILQELRNPVGSPIVSITGLGGIGKTSVACEVAHLCLSEGIFKGLVWESAKPEELAENRIVHLPIRASLSFESLICSIAGQLGQDTLLQQSSSDLLRSIRHLLQKNSVLIVVDNLETVDRYQDLTRRLYDLLSAGKSEQPSKALLTSRERLSAIPFVSEYYIQGLSKQSSIEFIEQEAYSRNAKEILQASRRVQDRIFTVSYGMPLAMKLIVSQFIAGIPLDTELDRLEGAKEEELYKFIYLRLWFKLSIPAQKILIAVATFASSVVRAMLQQVSMTTDEEFEVGIPELVRMALLDPSHHPTAAQRRYSIHPITRWFITAPLREVWEQQKADSDNDGGSSP